MTLQALHEHQQEHHSTVVSVLRSIGHDADVPFPLVREDFIHGDVDVTNLFWERLNALRPGLYLRVDWCYGCRKFNLHPSLAS